jgi:hypothetical protein
MDPKRELLRHTVATVAYRGSKAIRETTDAFASFKPADTARTPAQILAHVGDLYDWALSIARGAQTWNNSTPLPWDRETARFFDTLARFDAYLASDAPLSCSPEQLFQGPVADSLTHVGQLTMLRRLAGVRMRSENYFRADIVAGRVGLEQSTPRSEFD